MFKLPDVEKSASRVGVVTVTYNSSAVLDDFIASLLSQTHENFVLYAVDNASVDGSVARLREVDDPRFVVLPNSTNTGVAEGNNVGIRRALSDGCGLILLLNNDTVFGPNLFQCLMDNLRQTGADMISPKIYFHNSPAMVWFGGGHFRRGAGMMARLEGGREDDSPKFNERRQIEYAPTCCVLARNSVFSTVGEMDEAYFVYWDDTDFMLRARRHGLTLFYVPECTLEHKVSSLTGGHESDFTIRYDTRNLVYFTRRHFRTFGVTFWLSFHAFRLLGRYVVGRDHWRTIRPRIRAFREGLRMNLESAR